MSFRDIFADTRPLKEPAFKRLWLGNVATVIGAQLTVVAVPVQIYQMTGSSGYVGLTGLFGLIPLVIFGLYGGSIADAFDKRIVLICTTIGMCVTTAGFWVLTILGNENIWLLLINFSLQQAFFAVNQPTRTAILRSILPIDQLASATSLNMLLMQTGAIVGPLIAGALIPLIGFGWLYFLDVVSIIPTLWAVWSLPSIKPSGKVMKAGFASVVDGLKYLAGQPVLLMVMVLDLIAMIFGMPRALYPEIAEVNFGGGDAGATMLAFMYSSMAVGAVLGGVLSGWVARISRQGVAVYWCIIAWGAAVALGGVAIVVSPGAVTAWAWMFIIMMVIGGMADMFSSAVRNAILQQSAAEHVQGRIQGVWIIVVVGGPRLADVLHGWAAEPLGAGWTVLWGGVAVVVLTAICMVAVPKFWKYEKPKITGI
ncbi:putative drug efflux permease, MFS-type [Corynebacterium glutamicum MB001]|uniref:Permeases of the major facilitator superfamily n=2 Tax=Corynebacterium glutamicum TaxID=1718 RepID=Q8NU27_CORGL|nr:MFS transporter [Corynebacterium glutamicum]AGT04133.1 putative drug efflux permease, MFS-type [Corynebacterium glutamicum MB001]ARV65615.1 MFS transporter [Corynebacterium glutamicum]ASW12913.1 putative drug efflux permease, MFS-type [Corynebacterium glutamicum]AUH99756.1 MFS transporter [Corynebacterium glutamicum]AUI03394.1 MFS transporter [Corynebacterium glutamicum]